MKNPQHSTWKTCIEERSQRGRGKFVLRIEVQSFCRRDVVEDMQKRKGTNEVCEMEICFCICVYVFKEPQIKDKEMGRKRPRFKGKTLYWPCFLYFWVISVVFLPIFLPLADNWQNINHIQQTAQLQGRRRSRV